MYDSVLSTLSKDWTGILLSNAFYAVDVFFFIGGFFLSFSLLMGRKKLFLKNPINFFFIVFTRYMRIMPTYLLMILFFWKVLPFCGNDS
jgi:peptidoglycan/LPS O-acetylase OafA/YrhL